MARRVLLVESGSGYGGSAFSLLRLVKSLDPSRYEAHVVVFHHASAFEQIRALDVQVMTSRLLRPLFERSPDDRHLWTRARNYCAVYGNLAVDTLYNGFRLARYIRRKHIELVHLNNGLFGNLSAAFAARLAKVPCVSHERGAEGPTRVERQFVDWVSVVITLNRASVAEYVPVFGADKVRLIPNGVDLDAFRAPDAQRIRHELGIEPGAFAVGTFARLVDGKGIPEFVTTAARVSRKFGPCQFFIIGNDPTAARTLEARMRKLADGFGLGRQLVFTGWRNDRIDIMAAMDLVLQISTTFPEGMSLSPLEAMALGKPVIVTNIPGYEFSVDDGETGFVVAPADIDALTEKVLILARDRDLAQRMGRQGYLKAQRQFDVRLTARQVEMVYDQLLERPDSRPGLCVT